LPQVFDGGNRTLTAALLAVFCAAAPFGFGQDLAPRAYVITPVGSSAITAGYTFNTGSVFVDPSVPIQDFRVHFQTQTISYFYAFGVRGHSANIALVAPYAVANAQATVVGTQQKVYRSGIADSRVRFSLNLWGGPAMSTKDFRSWHEKGLMGVSITAIVPTGQYDPARLVNIGSNRWAFKPEIGFSRRWQRLVLEAYAGAWLYAPNNFYFPGDARRTQLPIGAGEAHLNYYAKPRLWVSLDGNFWTGGRSILNGNDNGGEQRNSRAGITVALPATRSQTFKFSYSRGTYVTIGGDYQTVSAAWQYSWIGKTE